MPIPQKCSFLDFPALPLNEKGWPVTDHDSAPQVPGLYFLGLPFQVGLTSTLLGGVGRDAELVVQRIVGLVQRRSQSSADDRLELSRVSNCCGDPNALKNTLKSMRAEPYMKGESETATEAARSTRAAAALVYVHAGIVIVHGLAHARLHVPLSTWAGVFVAVLIGIMPIVALVLLKKRSRFKGAVTLGTAMAASLVFGIWNHFVVQGGDHITHLSGGPWRLPFQVTAGLLAVTEGIGGILALQLLRSQTCGEAGTEPHRGKRRKGEPWPTQYSKR